MFSGLAVDALGRGDKDARSGAMRGWVPCSRGEDAARGLIPVTDMLKG